MNSKSSLFALLLLFWMSGSTYWYICKIKNDCAKQQIINKVEQKNSKIAVDTVNLNINNWHSDEKQAASETFKNTLIKGFNLNGFPYNSSDYQQFNDNFNQFVKNLKAYMDEYPLATVVLTGYTDNRGSEKKNKELSKKRAESLKNKLMLLGIDEHKIIIKAGGEQNPIADNTTELGRAQNRRVEIKLTENK